jgi:nitrogen fixation/metabolism regulation signal transduction histidine kinase
MQDKSSRLDEIDRELGDLPTDSSQLSELAAKIKADRDRIANLRAQLSASQRELLNESLRANSSRLAQSQMDYQEEVVALQQELSDAKIAVFQQQRILDLTIGSTPDTPPLPDIRKELERRKGIEAALERRIAEILANERNSVESSNAEEQSRLREWSDHQAMIEEDYSAAVSDLANSRRDYQEMAEENASARKKAQDLKTEKDELMKGN